MNRIFHRSLFAGLLIPLMAVAAQDDPASRLLREQRQMERDGASHVDTGAKVQIPAEGDLNVLPGNLPEPKPLILNPDIHVETQGLLSEEAVGKLIAPYFNLPLGEVRIQLLMRQLNAALVRRGVVTSKARIVRLERSSGRLDIELHSGRIESFLRDGKPLDKGMQMAFPNRPGDVFVLQDLEQGIHQIQRLRLYRAEANILPGQTPLASQIDLHLKEQKPWWFQASLDNQGTKTTGENRSRVTLTLEDPLHMLDSLGLSVVHSERSDAALISYAIPRGYDTWSLTYAASQYSQPLPGDLLQKGGSKSATLGWNRVLHLSAEGKDSLDVSLSHSDSTREISGIDLMPERLTVMRNSYSHLRQGQGWRYWAEGNLVGGLSAIGARQDAAGLDRASPHAQFAKTEVHAGAIVDSGLAGLSYIGQFDAQFSDQGLYGPEQFHLGGMNSVRGYVETAISGDSGYVFRHELHGKSWLQESTSTQVTPLIFFDHGLVRAVHGAAQQIYSTGIGARATASHWGADLVLARPLLHISDATDNGWRIHAVFRIDL